MKCSSCGTELENGQLFCPNCGKKIVNDNNINSQQGQVNANQQLDKPKKKKKYWWIPISLFIGMIVALTVNITLSITIDTMKQEIEYNRDLINILTGIKNLFSLLYLLSGLLILPSIIAVIIYNVTKK